MAKRNGFTLTELLVVLAIIVLLVGLTIPAVMYARESARRAQCQTHLAQLGQALHSHHSSRRTFPAAFDAVRGPHGAVVDNFSPHVDLLPYIEQGTLYGKIAPATSSAPHRIFPPRPPHDTVIPILECPSDPVAGGTNFRFCTGPDAYPYSKFFVPPGEGGLGAFIMFEALDAAGFRDGLSNTVGLSEKRKGHGDPAHFDPSTDPWYAGASFSPPPPTTELTDLCASLSVTPTSHFSSAGRSWLMPGNLFTWYNHAAPPNAAFPDCERQNPQPGEPTPGTVETNGGVHKASSYHRGGVHCLLMDGAVRFVADEVDLTIWRAVATRAGGETVTAF